MSTYLQALQQLRLVREAAANPKSAYVVRVRLKRALLSCARASASASGIQGPMVPGLFQPPVVAAPAVKRIANLCNTVLTRSEKLCQPSEALDIRWRAEWLILAQDLEKLESLLVSQGEATLTSS